MQTSLQGIANKAAVKKEHRFENLFGMLNVENALDSWKLLNKKAAYGVDKISAQDYEQNLQQNVEELIKEVKEKTYRAKLIRRQYIPKANGKIRGLGIPATSDKLLQKMVARILEAIYEQDFLASSYGYRPKLSPHNAIKDLEKQLQFGSYNFIVEADIKSYFDSIQHSVLLEMLKQRINDKPFLRLIEKWLKAGILDTNGKVIDPQTGVPQGGIVSPVVSNIYLHYVLDEWFEEVVKKHCKAKAYLCRFADDFVCAFETKEDAERFYKVLGKRLNKYGLELAEEKTKIINFDRFNKQERRSFEFLGFELRWGVSRNGKTIIKRQTAKKKLKNSIANIGKWIKENRNLKMRVFFEQLNAKLRGYYNYYGMIGNYLRLQYYFYQVILLLKKWLNRRSHKPSYTWLGFNHMLEHYKIEKPRIRAETIKLTSS
ncbi:MAG: group II intron reverse transcriptase/maturase [Blastocatellia bacterium]